MKKITMCIVLCNSLTASMQAISETGNFGNHDQDLDGALSIEEAKSAFPEMILVDMNNDGFLNRSEAEFALRSLNLPSESSCQDDRVREYDFHVIRQKLDENNERLKEELLGMRNP